MHKNDSSGFEGYCIDLIEELKTLMGFEYEIYEVKQPYMMKTQKGNGHGNIYLFQVPEYGTMNSSLHWNGLIKELVDKVGLTKCSSFEKVCL
jgi:hypothetical protein